MSHAHRRFFNTKTSYVCVVGWAAESSGCGLIFSTHVSFMRYRALGRTFAGAACFVRTGEAGEACWSYRRGSTLLRGMHVWMHFCRYLRSFVDIYESVFQFILDIPNVLKIARKSWWKNGVESGELSPRPSDRCSLCHSVELRHATSMLTSRGIRDSIDEGGRKIHRTSVTFAFLFTFGLTFAFLLTFGSTFFKWFVSLHWIYDHSAEMVSKTRFF